MKSTRNLTTVAEVVEDILESMSEADKANVANTPEDELILFHHGWGTGIRNHYGLWGNQELVRATGREHPDDASMVIIKAVWQALQESGETYQRGNIDTETLTWHVNKQCLEISAGGRSLVIDGIDFEFAEALANELRLLLYQTEMQMLPELEPQVTLEKRNASIKVWKYPAHPDNQ